MTKPWLRFKKPLIYSKRRKVLARRVCLRTAFVQQGEGRRCRAGRALRSGIRRTQAYRETVLGTVELYLRRPDAAEKSAREALSLEPNLPDGYLVLAAVYGVRNDDAAEIRNLDMFINLEPPPAWVLSPESPSHSRSLV
jgi:hypothetical protein